MVRNPGMAVYNQHVDCGRVSSLFAMPESQNRYAEVGWYEDPLPNAGAYLCLPRTTGTPTFLAFQQASDLSFTCMDGGDDPPGTPESGSPYEFSVHDTNADGRWQYKLDGTVLWSSPTSHTINTANMHSWTNGERQCVRASSGNPIAGCSPDSARSLFDRLNRMNSDGDWVLWQNSDSGTDPSNDDPAFHNCKDSEDRIRVIPDSETC